MGFYRKRLGHDVSCMCGNPKIFHPLFLNTYFNIVTMLFRHWYFLTSVFSDFKIYVTYINIIRVRCEHFESCTWSENNKSVIIIIASSGGNSKKSYGGFSSSRSLYSTNSTSGKKLRHKVYSPVKNVQSMSTHLHYLHMWMNIFIFQIKHQVLLLWKLWDFLQRQTFASLLPRDYKIKKLSTAIF